MPNIEKTYIFNNTIEIERGYSANYGRKMAGKNEKYRPTPEKMAEHNRKQAENKLRRKIKANFTSDDWHMTLTYDKRCRPLVEEAVKQINSLLRKARYFCKKTKQVLKYIVVTEYENAAIHHHVVINNFEGIMDFMKKNWKWNVNYSPIHDDDDVATLAAYLIKETEKTFRNKVGRKLRYSCSRNLVEPKAEVRIHKVRGFGEIKVPKRFAGNYIIDTDSIVETVNDLGHVHQSFTLKLVEDARKGQRWDTTITRPI